MNDLTRREVIQRVTALLGGAALVGGDSLAAFTFDEAARVEAMAQGAGSFTAADIALLDEIAETILPQTSTPGAKAAKTGAFIALMVTDTYTDRAQEVFRDGMKKLEDECRRLNHTTFMTASAAQRLAVAKALDLEQKSVMDERQGPRPSRAPFESRSSDEPAHYFRMIKELTLLGFFTSQVGMTQALRYIETPGRYDPCAPHKPGDKSWAAHA